MGFLFKRNMDRTEKIYISILFFIRFTLILAVFTSIYAKRWTILFVTLATLILTFLPRKFEEKYNINLPLEFEIVTILFIYATLFLGEVHGYYTRFFWWDALLHTGSAIAFGFIGFTILLILYKGKRINAKPGMLAIITFFFAVGIGAVWEIYEFGMDQIFGFNMQKSGLIDTMWDLIIDSIGALFASILGYFYLKNDESFIYKRLINKFKRENPHFFK
jgi:hypothetical protein